MTKNASSTGASPACKKDRKKKPLIKIPTRVRGASLNAAASASVEKITSPYNTSLSAPTGCEDAAGGKNADGDDANLPDDDTFYASFSASASIVRKPTPPRQQYENKLIDYSLTEFIRATSEETVGEEDLIGAVEQQIARRYSDANFPRTGSKLSIAGELQPTIKEQAVDETQFRNTPMVDIIAALKAGVNIRDRKKKFRTYRSCFSGVNAVNTMMDLKFARDKEEAVVLGNLLMKMNYIRHVTGNRLFKNSNDVYFQFVSRLYRATSAGFGDLDMTECQLQMGDFDLSTIDEAMQMVINGVQGISLEWFRARYAPYYIGITGSERMLEQGYALDEAEAQAVGEKAFQNVLSNLTRFPRLKGTVSDKPRVKISREWVDSLEECGTMAKRVVKVKEKIKNRKMRRALNNEAVLRANRHFYTHYH
ncbi:hypothetical protein SARC_00680 [Sphaeroforma arctica JP610]|uniref:DEP domain-containing protein n=1 Tax=Sphaeroforma arctica JP610 TaxID=667725 RepID=A0A0L0GFZ2_9EUKA|nr:hypothetical protein SARC_00680 [Sphaeroforma arctica JP610]KNC87203.1 hypothetical protein SARC_00680 [Sphaeroforma arctica JP610]|eukprot:XP_014161105.1 hypothetical protein SARC_00680 [Sphaeroforma arctica JP610]